MEFIIVNEFSLPRLMWRSLLGLDTVVVRVHPYLEAPDSGWIAKLVRWLYSKNRVRVLSADHPETISYPMYGDLMRRTNSFEISEPWMERHFNFDQSDARLGEFAIAYRNACSSDATRRLIQAFLINDIFRAFPAARVTGIEGADRSLYWHLFGHVPDGFLPSRFGAAWFRCVMVMAVLARSLVWVLRRMRIRPAPGKSYLLGSDYVSGHSNKILWEEIADDKDDILIVFRSEALKRKNSGSVEGYPSAVVTDGQLSIFGAIRSIYNILVSVWRLCLFCRGQACTATLRDTCALPYRKVVYEAFFNRFPCQYFWGRDDYNAGHALRTTVMRNLGTTSLGLMHGISSITETTPQQRHVDFDIYYTQGWDQARKNWFETWPAHMLVRPIGSVGLSRAELHRLSSDIVEDGVACFLSPCFFDDEVIETVSQVAQAFPERRIFLGIKPGDWSTAFGQKLKAALTAFPDNVVVYDGVSYDLFFLCDTALSVGSTLAAEAVQFHCHSFVLDYHSTEWIFNPYRRYPGVCVNSIDELLERMTAVRPEATFPDRPLWGSMIDLSGRVPWDEIRKDMGKPALDPPLSWRRPPRSESMTQLTG